MSTYGRRKSVIALDMALEAVATPGLTLAYTDNNASTGSLDLLKPMPTGKFSSDLRRHKTLSMSLHTRTNSDSAVPHMGDRNLVPCATYDNHNEYKVRVRNSSKKLENFFGDKPPLDISGRELNREGLKAMLQSKVPLCYFLLFLLEEYSCENLFFFLEVEQYESFRYPSKSSQYDTAEHVFDTYLTHNSQFEVNVDDKVRKHVTSAIKSPEQLDRCFDEAKRAVFILLEGSYSRFLRSDAAELMWQRIGMATTEYSSAAKGAAIGCLYAFLERQESPTGSSGRSSVSRRRNQLIRAMVCEFIYAFLEVDMANYDEETFRQNIAEAINPKITVGTDRLRRQRSIRDVKGIFKRSGSVRSR